MAAPRDILSTTDKLCVGLYVTFCFYAIFIHNHI